LFRYHERDIGDFYVKQISSEEGKSLIAEKSSKLTEYEKACELMTSMMQGPNGDKGVVDDEVKRTVYVGNLSRLCTPQDLRTEFSPIGEVVYIKFSQDCPSVV
jgi:hypothetical protein